MKTLYIVRHAKSSWDNPSLQDYERPLNKRGVGEAPKMAEVLAAGCRKPDLIISSPARRALETAEHFAEAFCYPISKIKTSTDIYEATVNDLLEVLENISDTHKRVLLFGHNPGLNHLVNFLSPVSIDKLPTCGIVCLEFDVKRWKKIALENCEFKFFEYPKKSLKNKN